LGLASKHKEIYEDSKHDYNNFHQQNLEVKKYKLLLLGLHEERKTFLTSSCLINQFL
jgi:hypothetical protein